jgi:hypothetical protein
VVDSANTMIHYSFYEVYLFEGRSRSIDLDLNLTQGMICESGQLVSLFRECHHWINKVTYQI